jgi:HAD superfamily hydrolase (TIGR01549 family)
MADAAVIFDVDGVLLELTSAEEDVFFAVFESRYGLTGLSRDWNSYEIRNDENIVEEILRCNGLPPADRAAVIADYVSLLEQKLESRLLQSVAVAGAAELLKTLDGRLRLGVATANFRSAAKLRLEQAGLWPFVSEYAYGAEGGGHKRETVAKAISALALPKARIVYVGDNLNDVEAGLANGVHFIGFSGNPVRLSQLKSAGAARTSANHPETCQLIVQCLKLNLPENIIRTYC